MTSDAVITAFSNFSIEDMTIDAAVSRRVLRRLEGIDNSTTSGAATSAARAELASSVVAHPVVEFDSQSIELKKQLVQAK
jgi:hypothetical protein